MYSYNVTKYKRLYIFDSILYTLTAR